jgi:hypothetical protein
MRKPQFLFAILALALFYCTSPVSAQTYSFLGLSTGQTRPQVISQLVKLGYTRLPCTHDSIGLTCTADNSPDQHMQHMKFFFTNGAFTGLTFDFDPSYWTDLLESITSENGRPTKPMSQLGRGVTVTWNDRPTCPCEGLSLIRDGRQTSFMWINAPLAMMPAAGTSK